MLLCFALQVALFILNVKSTNLANTVSFRPANTNSSLHYFTQVVYCHLFCFTNI